ncbi:MAG TPA: TolC family protein [Saprospiraceae bacterium]|nr:TolC family protein [Saprospiraceae bacterium]HRX29921.1 TolC family protein [Saprospiraceae bacterium]
MTKIKLIILLSILYSGMFGQRNFSLSEAIDYALSENSKMKQASLNAEDASLSVREFKSIGIPQINGKINYQYYIAVPQQPIVDFITPSIYQVLFDENVIPEKDLGPPRTSSISFFQPNNLSGSLEVNSLLFDGSYLYGLKAAKLYKELSVKQIKITEQEIRANVTKAYLGTLIAIETRKFFQDNLGIIQKSLNDAEKMYENGFVESLDVDRLTLSRDKINLELQKIDHVIEINKNLLKFQMEFPLQDSIILTDKFDEINQELLPNGLVDKPSINYNDRAEYDVLNTNIQLNELNVKRIKAGRYPSARAFANLQSSLQRENLFDSNETGWLTSAFVGLGINLPIYDGGTISAQSERAKVNLENLKIEREDFENSIQLVAENAWLQYQSAKMEVETNKKSLEISQRIFNKSNIKFQEGIGSSIELQQAESDLYIYQNNYINAIYGQVKAAVDLLEALGKL